MERYKKKRNLRADHMAGLRATYEANRKAVFYAATACAICGRPFDKSLKWPDPRCMVLDHIRPLNRGGDPIALDNMQAVCNCCNRSKSDKWSSTLQQPTSGVISNRDLPLSLDWTQYRADKGGRQ